MSEVIIVDQEGARREAEQFALGEEVIQELFGQDARSESSGRTLVMQLGEMVKKLAFSYISYEKGAQKVETN